MTSQRQQQEQQQQYNTNYKYNNYNQYSYNQYHNYNNNKEYKHSSVINVIYQIEEFIKNDYQQIRDNILYGIVYPILLFLLCSTIIAILIQLIKYIFYPPTVYDIHMTAVKILLSNSNNITTNNDAITLSLSSEINESVQQQSNTNTIVPYQLMDIHNNSNNNNKNTIQQKHNATEIKIKKSKKLPSSKELFRKIFNYNKGNDNDEQQQKLTNEYAIQLLYNCCIINGYTPAGITLAAYYLYKLNQPFYAQNIIQYCINLINNNNNNYNCQNNTNQNNNTNTNNSSPSEMQNKENNEMTTVETLLSNSSSTIHISNNNNTSKTIANDTTTTSSIVQNSKYNNRYTGTHYDSTVSSMNDILYDINIVKSSIIKTNTNSTTSTNTTTFNNTFINSMMIQTVLREDEYISIPYVQQYKLIWKQYQIRPPTTNIINNINSNNYNNNNNNNINNKTNKSNGSSKKSQ